MPVFHGSYTEIETVDLSKRQANKDFGSDFYVTKFGKQFCGCFLFFLLFVSCKEITRPLEVSDLKLNQTDLSYPWIYNNKEILAINKIDTMFLVVTPDSGRRQCSRWINDVEYWTDTIGYYAYDEDGRLLERHIFCMFSSDKFQYDSVGLLKGYQHSSDIGNKEKICHHFVSDSLLLYQHRYDYSDSNKAYVSIQFKFDKQGKILEEK